MLQSNLTHGNKEIWKRKWVMISNQQRRSEDRRMQVLITLRFIMNMPWIPEWRQGGAPSCGRILSISYAPINLNPPTALPPSAGTPSMPLPAWGVCQYQPLRLPEHSRQPPSTMVIPFLLLLRHGRIAFSSACANTITSPPPVFYSTPLSQHAPLLPSYVIQSRRRHFRNIKYVWQGTLTRKGKERKVIVCHVLVLQPPRLRESTCCISIWPGKHTYSPLLHNHSITNLSFGILLVSVALAVVMLLVLVLE